jgi:hypothetical protein
MRLINLTPHEIILLIARDVELKIPSSGIARVDHKRIKTGQYIKGIPIYKRSHHRIIGLPKPKNGNNYIVSRATAECAWRDGREDVYALSGKRIGQNGTIRFRSLDANPYKKNEKKK